MILDTSTDFNVSPELPDGVTASKTMTPKEYARYLDEMQAKDLVKPIDVQGLSPEDAAKKLREETEAKFNKFFSQLGLNVDLHYGK